MPRQKKRQRVKEVCSRTGRRWKEEEEEEDKE